MNGKAWSPEEVGLLIRLYPETPNAALASLFGRPACSVFKKAKRLGLAKSPAYRESPASGRFRRGDNAGKEHRFRKGHVPANKGLRRPGYGPGRMSETQFREGAKPFNWQPVGSERLCGGYWQRKVTDTGYPPRDWKFVHRLLWEEANGPVPPGHVVIFIDGDKGNIALANLRLASRSELGRRNVMWNRYPRELSETIQLAGALKRKINRRSHREKQD
ncbi:MAG: HNH endonuclease signature motif containing protein [Leptospirales bacterium]